MSNRLRVSKAAQPSLRQVAQAMWNGAGDYDAHTPWAHAPVSQEDWETGNLTEEQFVLQNYYWQGWESRTKDAISRAQVWANQQARKEAHP